MEFSQNDRAMVPSRPGSGVLVQDHTIQMRGVYEGIILRAGKVIDRFRDINLVVNEGLNHILNVEFNGATQVTTWYLSVFEGNYTPVAGLTAATYVAASTECTAYADSNRPTYVEAASTAQSLTNSASRGSFVFNATKTIYGAALLSVATKSSGSGTLFSAARFSTSKAVESGDELLLTYTFTAASA